jgi:arsenate reductase
MTSAATIYGIKSCDTMRRARQWLGDHGVAYEFHDYQKSGIDAATLASWVQEVGWETLLNRAGTTFRKRSEADRTDLDADTAMALMRAQPSMIKRPVLRLGTRLIVGFRPETYAATFG